MKIGILTFVNAPNFGAVLQSYASQEYISKLHIDAELINYFPGFKDSSPKKSKTRVALNKLNALYHPFITLYRKQKTAKLKEFRNDFLNISKNIYYNEIQNLDENYDVIIAGSDQIWNTDLNNCRKSFYLDFNTSAKKAGYAVSIGREKLTQSDRDMIHKYINNFEYISVREESLKEYIYKQKNINCELVCDPVFLLDNYEWDKIAISPYEKNYILVYAMEYNDILLNAVKKLKNKTGKKIYCINGGNSGKLNLPARILNGLGPREFIGWIENADIILTNSFHGAAFSIIFRNKLIVIEHSKRNERLKQLLNKCNNSNKIISLSENDYRLDEKIINTEDAIQYLEEFISTSKKYMEDICRGHINE